MHSPAFAMAAGADVRRRQIAQLVQACTHAATSIAETQLCDHDPGLLLITVVETRSALISALDRSACAETDGLRYTVRAALTLLGQHLDRGDPRLLAQAADLLARADGIARLEGWKPAG